jgi:hypothetical protein
MNAEHDEAPSEGPGAPPEEIPLAREHPRLYGILLSVNQRVDDAGSNAIWIFGLAAVGLCVAIHLRWLEPVLGVEMDSVRSGGVYTLIILVAIFIGGSYIGWLERRAYAAHREEIRQALRGTDLDRYTLLAAIETDDSLEDVRPLIKKDDTL